MRTNLRVGNRTSTALSASGVMPNVKFNDLTDSKFILHLKEIECRFNHGNDNFASFKNVYFGGSYKRYWSRALILYYLLFLSFILLHNVLTNLIRNAVDHIIADNIGLTKPIVDTAMQLIDANKAQIEYHKKWPSCE